jgi:hypothetical protein
MAGPQQRAGWLPAAAGLGLSHLKRLVARPVVALMHVAFLVAMPPPQPAGSTVWRRSPSAKGMQIVRPRSCSSSTMPVAPTSCSSPLHRMQRLVAFRRAPAAAGATCARRPKDISSADMACPCERPDVPHPRSGTILTCSGVAHPRCVAPVRRQARRLVRAGGDGAVDEALQRCIAQVK